VHRANVVSGLCLAVATAAAVLLSSDASARAATVTVGSTLTPPFVASEYGTPLTVMNAALPESGAQVVSPIDGTIVRWRVLSTEGGPFKLRVLRRVAGMTFTGVGTSGPEMSAGAALQTFATSLPIQAGDAIGLDNSSGSDKIGRKVIPGAQYSYWEPPLPSGATAATTGSVANLEFAFNADVQPPPSISSISPASGPSTGGTTVTIAGGDFNEVSAVEFGGLPAAGYDVSSESQIVATSPAAAPGPVAVTVTTVAGTSPGGVFTYAARRRTCRVPRLRHRRLKAARRVLRKGRCRLGRVRRKRRARAPRVARIVRQRPRPGSIRPVGTKVSVTMLVRQKSAR
jgi:IPT/TIG domain